MACAATFLAFSALQGPNSVMVRPHPVVWRLVYGMAILYLLALVFLLFQGKDEARSLLKVCSPYCICVHLQSCACIVLLQTRIEALGCINLAVHMTSSMCEVTQLL